MTKKITLILLFFVTIIYLISAYFVDLLDSDATQYATIAMQMNESSSYLQIMWRDVQYLDKPPLLFWLSSFFFSIFGTSHFVYRLPSILVGLLGIYSTYRLGKKLYNETTGLYASVIFASALGIFIIAHDVRTDTMLTGFIVFSIWQLLEYIDTRKIGNYILAFIGIGLSMLTKGPIGIMVPILALGSHFIYQRKWKVIFDWRWLPGLLIIAAILTPMVVGLYRQFGETGIRFFFWTQSFGRLTGENVWVDNTDSFFFLHSFLWSFLPWSLLAVAAYVLKFGEAIKFFNKENRPELVTLGGITLVFIGMSSSQYKLPHYIYVIFPLFAVLTANFLFKTFEKGKLIGFSKAILISQQAVNWLLWIIFAVAAFYLFPISSFLVGLVCFLVFALFLYLFFQKKPTVPKIFTTTAVTIIGVAFYLSITFYPSLSIYQAGSVFGKYILEKNIPAEDIVIYRNLRHSIDFYAQKIIPSAENVGEFDSILKKKDSLYVFTSRTGLDELGEMNEIRQVKLFKDFHISTLSGKFINPETRAAAVDTSFFVVVKKNNHKGYEGSSEGTKQ